MVQVGTNFDPKEQLFRNFAGLFGPDSDLSVKLSWEPGTAVSTPALIVVFPTGSVSSEHLNVTVSDETTVVTLHRLNLDRPLASGVWSVRVVERSSSDGRVMSYVSQVKFFVASESVDQTSLSAAWRLVGSCLIVDDSGLNSTSCSPQSSSCVQTPLSSRYPDPKSWLGQAQRVPSYAATVR